MLVAVSERSVALLLEERHAAMLAELAYRFCEGSHGAAAAFLDAGRDVAAVTQVETIFSSLGESTAPAHNLNGHACTSLANTARADDGHVSIYSLDEPMQVERRGKGLCVSVTAPMQASIVQNGSCVLSDESMQDSGCLNGRQVLIHDPTRDSCGDARQGSVCDSSLAPTEICSPSDTLQPFQGHLTRSFTSVALRKRIQKSFHPAAAGEQMTREVVMRRLQAKLGNCRPGQSVSADGLHASLESLSLSTFDLDTIKDFVLTLAIAFVKEKEEPSKAVSRGSVFSKQSAGKRSSKKAGGSVQVAALRSSGVSLPLGMFGTRSSKQEPVETTDSTLPFNVLVEVMLMDDSELKKALPAETVVQVEYLREVLLSSDANCLVAELMHLRVDDLAQPLPSPTLLDYIEPLVSLAILMNALLIGLSTDRSFAEHPALLTAEKIITSLFIIELIVKLWHSGPVMHFLGPDRNWNWFDLLLVGESI